MSNTYQEPVWYRQFWPWFLIVLPGTVVIASFITLYIAIVNSHSMVKDDYYKDGLAINQYLQEDKLAKQMGITASIKFIPGSQQVKLELTGDIAHANQLLILSFIDPVDSDVDFDLPLQLSATGSYQQSLLKLELKRWYLHLSPADASPDQRWKIRGEIDLTQQFETTLASSRLD